MGKTDSVIDVILSRLDQRPVPIIYAGPDRHFVTDSFEPRFDDALNRSANLAVKLARGKKNKKNRKIVSGVPVRLAWAGSANQLKSDPADLAIVDERDGMAKNIKGEETRCDCSRSAVTPTRTFPSGKPRPRPRGQ